MTDKARRVLKNIADKAAENTDHYVIGVEMPVEDGEEAHKIRDELVAYRCISRAELFGRYYIRCQLEHNALNYLK